MEKATDTQVPPDKTSELIKQLAARNRDVRAVLNSNLPDNIKVQVITGAGKVFPYRDCPCGSGKKFKFCCYPRS
jgi:uncharacterized protein YecA (UPF0149 family)